MAATFDDLRILKISEDIADEVWKRVVQWDEFARDALGKQLATAVDSIGANIAESYGRYSFGEKLQFLYYARGSLFETKYWINRTRQRNLISPAEAQVYATKLTDLARQLNAFRSGLRIVKYETQHQGKSVRETLNNSDETSMLQGDEWTPIFSDDELNWLHES